MSEPMRASSGEDPRTSTSRRGDLGAAAALTAAWWVAVVIVDPRGDFPINDDWGYAVPVRAIVEEGTLRFADWQSMPLLTQALWGAAFAAALGFSFTALRLSTLVLGWAGVLATFALLRALRVPSGWAGLGAAALGFSPLYFPLAFSFMTDVPFVASMIAASTAWVWSKRTGRAGWVAIATLLAIVATLDRQIGIALPVAWACAELLHGGPSRRWLVRGVAPLVLVVGALVAFQKLTDATIGLPAFYHTKSVELMDALRGLVRLRGLRYPLERSALSLVYLGLLSAPLTLGAAASIARRRVVSAGAAVALLVGLALAAVGLVMPLTGNIWIDFGVGPRTLPGEPPRAPAALWKLVTALGVGTAWLLLVVLALGLRARTQWDDGPPAERFRRMWAALRGRALPGDDAIVMPVWIGLSLTALVSFAPTAIVYGPFFDRYLLAQLPFVLALVGGELARRTAPQPSRAAPQPSRAVAPISAALVLVSALFSIGATHDHLAWQRARWALVERADQRGIARESLAGGFEVDNHPAPPGPPIEREGAEWRLALSELEGHEIVEHEPVEGWLPWSVEAVYLMRRQ